MFIAERGGFEPPEPTWSSTVFETAPFDHSGIFPKGNANISANFQFHQNFHTEFCNMDFIVHICTCKVS